MSVAVKTSAFKSGNSVAVRLPKALGIKAGEELELLADGEFVRIRRVVDPAIEKEKVRDLVRTLRKLGPVDVPKPREPIEFPDRPGLY